MNGEKRKKQKFDILPEFQLWDGQSILRAALRV
jgi:hypothetical protein